MRSSRRNFLQSALAAPLLARLGGGHSGGAWVETLLASPAQMEFENPHIIRYDSSCFTIFGKDTIIFSGAFHYPRCPKALWRDRLTKFQAAGFNTIETYAFWNYHEAEKGKSNLTDLEDFIKLVHQMGFYMIVRPGPYVCAEWERGGFPDWVAAMRFPLRSDHPESIETSRYWYDQVLPVIQRHQVTVGGPIIMVQVENEYDYSPPMPDADKREYVRALANMVWRAGISVPVITCWTKQARENSDRDMAKIMDTCNFYPGWNIVKEVVPELQKLRKEEPSSPLAVTELQGGWFSEFGGKLSVDQEGVNAEQLDTLTKTVLEQGVTYFSYYMGFGGTNFGWAAKNLTTTYDYAAPIREPGGLWDKYYAARGICQFLRLHGAVLARAQAPEGGAESTNPNVTVTERVNGQSGVVFVRENANAEQRYKMTFVDPNSPTQRRIRVPRDGELALGPREMKMLPVQVPIPGSQLRYSTAEVLAHGLNLDRHFLILYDLPGRVAEIALATRDEPHIEGETLYQYWDPEYESVIFGVQFEKTEKLLLVNDHLLVILLPRDRALRSWITEFPSKVVPFSEGTKSFSVPFISDSYMFAGSGSHANRIWADLDFLPGQHDLTLLLPLKPGKCWVNGALTEVDYEREHRAARLQVTTPPLPYKPLDLSNGQAWVERFDTSSGHWQNGTLKDTGTAQQGVVGEGPGPLPGFLRALEESGPAPYGYVKYKAQFNYTNEPKMFISTFAADAVKVFINGKPVEEALKTAKAIDFELAKYAKPGTNTLEIAYEAFGAYNGDKEMGDLKGIEFVRVGSEAQSAQAIDSWQIQRFAPPMRGGDVDPNFAGAAWSRASYRASDSADQLVPAFTWCQTRFAMPGIEQGWMVPWKLTFEADRDALIYLNGKFVGRYVTVGPQKDFYLPGPYFAPAGENTLTFALAYTDRPGHLRTLRVAPYEEFAAHRTHVEFQL
jgi:hypothetical protein